MATHSHTLTHNYTQLACCLLLVWVMVWCAVDRVSGNMRGISASWIDRDDHILPVRKRQSDRYTRCSFEIIIGGQVCTLLAHLNSVLHHAIAARSVTTRLCGRGGTNMISGSEGGDDSVDVSV